MYYRISPEVAVLQPLIAGVSEVVLWMVWGSKQKKELSEMFSKKLTYQVYLT
jgi:hypothetical protein